MSLRGPSARLLPAKPWRDGERGNRLSCAPRLNFRQQVRGILEFFSYILAVMPLGALDIISIDVDQFIEKVDEGGPL